MEALSIVAGLLLVLVGIGDLFGTVIWVSAGPGPVTGWVGSLGWKAALAAHRPGSDASHVMLSLAGPALLISAAILWYLFHMVGWALVFVPDAFQDPGSVGFGDRLLFSAATVLGQVPEAPTVQSGGWDGLRNAVRFTGIGIASLGLAYVIPIIEAVAQKRQLAVMINAVGETPDEMIDRARRSPDGSGSLHLHMINWTASIALTAERHVTYPVLHYFHSTNRTSALPPAIAAAALLLHHDLGDFEEVDPTVAEPLGRAITHLIETLRSNFIDIDEEGLDDPYVDEDNRNEAPSVPILEAYIGFDGWEWSELGFTSPARE